MSQTLLFIVPATGKKQSKRKPVDVKVNRVNRELARQRYYLHTQLGKEFKINGHHRIIIAPYKSFEEVPIGPRYYINELIKINYNIQYELL